MLESLAQTTDHAGALWRVCADPSHKAIVFESTRFDEISQVHNSQSLELPYGEASQPLPDEMAQRLKLDGAEWRYYTRDTQRVILPAEAAQEVDELSRQMLTDCEYVALGQLREAAGLAEVDRQSVACLRLAEWIAH